MINKRYAKLYCYEDISKIENFEQAVADTTQTWQCHHRGEVLPCGNYSKATLKKFNLYWKRPASELIFVTKSMHMKIHSTDRAKAGKIGAAKMTFEQRSKGGKIGVKKMNAKLTFEQRSKGGKIGGKKTAAKMTFEQRSKNTKGKKWWNNGVINRRAKECPGDGWVPGKWKKNR